MSEALLPREHHGIESQQTVLNGPEFTDISESTKENDLWSVVIREGRGKYLQIHRHRCKGYRSHRTHTDFEHE